jgi:hypothetical protein
LFSTNLTGPTDARENIENIFRTPDGNLTRPVPKRQSILKTLDEDPGLRTYFIPSPGVISKRHTGWFLGNCFSKKKLCFISKIFGKLIERYLNFL